MSECRKCGLKATSVVVLLTDKGEPSDPDGDFPTCPECTQSLIGVLVPNYLNGEPAFRVEQVQPTPRHAADRALARVRAWWTERRARREARDDEEVAWLDVLGTPEDFKQDICGPLTQGRHRLNTFATKVSADAYVARYERDRCVCGGSPSWIDPAMQIHRMDCPRITHTFGIPDQPAGGAE